MPHKGELELTYLGVQCTHAMDRALSELSNIRGYLDQLEVVIRDPKATSFDTGCNASRSLAMLYALASRVTLSREIAKLFEAAS